MKRLLITPVLALALLAGTQAQAQANGGCGFGVGFGFGLSFSCKGPSCYTNQCQYGSPNCQMPYPGIIGFGQPILTNVEVLGEGKPCGPMGSGGKEGGSPSEQKPMKPMPPVD